MENLFESDYDSEEEEFKASGVKESPARDGGRSNEDLFRDEAGDRGASGGGDETTATRTICGCPGPLKPPDGQELYQQDAQHPASHTKRWRYKRDPATGRVLLDDETKLPLRESNAKLVQWEDGTFSMFVGKEALTLSRQKLANSFLFVNEMASDSPNSRIESVLECHARLKEKFTIRPMTTASKPHKTQQECQKLKEYISELDGEREQEQRVKITDEKLRLQNRKKAHQGYEYDRERSSRMDAQFLEEGYDAMDYDDDEHVGAIKEQFGKRKSSAANRKQGVRRPVPGGGFDEYRSSQRQRELECEREVKVSGQRSESDNDAGVDEGEDDEEEEKMVIRSHKKRPPWTRRLGHEDSMSIFGGSERFPIEQARSPGPIYAKPDVRANAQVVMKADYRPVDESRKWGKRESWIGGELADQANIDNES
ncbi:Leo1-like protein [Phytophthora cactorum]|nr:Leo1-like protein [Phytophthora cactorum]